MNTIQLEYFISVAQLQSFTKAAKKHFVSQTAITQQIQILEESLHVQLIDRTNRPICLTNAGSIFYMEATAIMERMNRAFLKVQTAANGISGTLNIAYLKGYERSNLSNKLRAFHQKFPNIFMTADRGNRDDLATGLANDAYDVIFTWEHTATLSKTNFSSKMIETSSLSVALYSSHPLAQRESLTRADLSHEAFIYYTPSTTFSPISESRFFQMYKEAGYEPRILFRSSDVESVLMMVAAEEGISIIPSYITNKLGNAEHLVFVPLLPSNEREDILAIWKTNPSKEELIHFLDFLASFD